MQTKFEVSSQKVCRRVPVAQRSLTSNLPPTVMSSRQGYRRRERSWERDDRDRGHDRGGRSSRGGRGSGGYRDGGRKRDSRSRSPRERERRGGPDRRDYDRKDYRRDDDRRDRRNDTRRGDRNDYDRDDPRDKDRDKRKDDYREDRSREPVPRPEKERTLEREDKRDRSPRQAPASNSRPNLDPDAPDDDAVEEGEEMDATNDDDSVMMAMMGLSGFGTTKGKHIEGNQEGAVNVKKVRTWRQYMNRRGGFNRPLDKIK